MNRLMRESILSLETGLCQGVSGFLLQVAAILCFVLPAGRAEAQDQVLAAITNFSQTGPIVYRT